MSKKRRKNTSWIFGGTRSRPILIFVAIFLVIACGIFYYATNNQKNMSTSGWKEFNDAQHHFSYKYPPEFVQTKDYGTSNASQFTLTSRDFVDFGSPIGQRTAVTVQYSEGSLFQNITNIAELKKFVQDNSKSKENKHLELIRNEEVLVGGKPALFVVNKLGESHSSADNYRSYYSIRGFIKINDNETVLISSSIINSPYDESLYKVFFSTFKFY